MPIKLVTILAALVCFALAAPAPKGKAPAAKAPAPSKAKTAVAVRRPPVVAKAKPRAAYPKPAYKGASKALAYARGKAPVPAAARVANSRAVYSRTPTRYAKGPAGRRVPVAKQPQVFVPMQPSPERYREIQQALADKGFFAGEVNGTWSSGSVEALKTFQRSQNLDADGKLGSLSLIALGLGPKRVIAAQNTPPAASQQPQR